MASSFNENIRKIRGTAVYGPEMRNAIVDAIIQALDVEVQEIDPFYPDSDKTYFRIAPIDPNEQPDDYIMEIINYTA